MARILALWLFTGACVHAAQVEVRKVTKPKRARRLVCAVCGKPLRTQAAIHAHLVAHVFITYTIAGRPIAAKRKNPDKPKRDRGG